MGILRKTVRTQNYNQANVAYQDTTLTSEVFNVGQLPSTFPIGKSAFTIAGSTLLRPKIKLQIDILSLIFNNIIKIIKLICRYLTEIKS